MDATSGGLSRQRATCLAALFIATIVPGSAWAEKELIVDASSLSPSSPRQWVYEGAEPEAGAVGHNIVMTPGPGGADANTEILLSFDGDAPLDESGRWSVETIGPYGRSTQSRFGVGAGAFRAPATKLVLQPSARSLFAPDTPMGDFTLEFWLKPTRADSGEIVMLWKSSRHQGKSWLSQQISSIILRNRMVFGFINFFADPSGKPTTISLKGDSIIVPGAWSHHLVRFDSATGLVEYLMNGEPEAIAYATSTGKQQGTIFNPTAGGTGRLELAQNYTGLIDEFRLSTTFVEKPVIARYAASGGAATSPIYDLGSTGSSLLSFGITARVPGESAVQWTYRTGDSSAGWRDDSPAWLPFSPSAALSNPDGSRVKGRYVQVRMELYPDASGERSPAVSSIRIRYEPDEPPAPPAKVSVWTGDGRAIVRWSSVAEADVKGYVVYYGSASGDYFGTDAREGASPIFVRGADATSLPLNGLKNGTLYFIAVAAYDDAEPPHIGEFSREITARPSRVSP